MLKKEDLIVGDIYVQDYNKDGDRNYIFKYKDRQKIGYGDYISKCLTSFYLDNGSINNSSSQKIHKATPEEKAWLLACIEAKKFIPLKDVKFNVEEYKVC